MWGSKHFLLCCKVVVYSIHQLEREQSHDPHITGSRQLLWIDCVKSERGRKGKMKKIDKIAPAPHVTRNPPLCSLESRDHPYLEEISAFSTFSFLFSLYTFYLERIINLQFSAIGWQVILAYQMNLECL
jgi:hypothetical protein